MLSSELVMLEPQSQDESESWFVFLLSLVGFLVAVVAVVVGVGISTRVVVVDGDRDVCVVEGLVLVVFVGWASTWIGIVSGAAETRMAPTESLIVE